MMLAGRNQQDSKQITNGRELVWGCMRDQSGRAKWWYVEEQGWLRVFLTWRFKTKAEAAKFFEERS